MTRKFSSIRQAVLFASMLLLALTYIYPFIYTFMNSLRTKIDFIKYPFRIEFNRLSFNNYIVLISQMKILLSIKNTFSITIWTISFLLVFSTMSSCAFAKLKFSGSRFVYLLILTTLFIPGQVTMIPMYAMFSKAGLVGRHFGVIISYLASFLPGTILLLTSHFKGIPDEMIEAAKMDGCSYWRSILIIYVPMGLPAIAISIIFSFLGVWNDLFTPMILIPGTEKRTVMVALSTIIGRYGGDATYQFAGMTLVSIPTILVYLIFQRFIVEGISLGSIK
jgi:ABC-type glycerol-3-phosphate transport system permease component